MYIQFRNKFDYFLNSKSESKILKIKKSNRHMALNLYDSYFGWNDFQEDDSVEDLKDTKIIKIFSLIQVMTIIMELIMILFT